MKNYGENDYLLVRKSNIGYLEFSVEDDVFDSVKDCFNADSSVDNDGEMVRFNTLNIHQAAHNAIVVAYNNSDSLIPHIVLYRDTKELEYELKKWVKDYLANAESVVNNYAKNSEIEEFVSSLCRAGNQHSLQLVENDYEVVATAFVLGGNDE